MSERGTQSTLKRQVNIADVSILHAPRQRRLLEANKLRVPTPSLQVFLDLRSRDLGEMTNGCCLINGTSVVARRRSPAWLGELTTIGASCQLITDDCV